MPWLPAKTAKEVSELIVSWATNNQPQGQGPPRLREVSDIKWLKSNDNIENQSVTAFSAISVMLA
jgi:hypothetical protein